MKTGDRGENAALLVVRRGTRIAARRILFRCIRAIMPRSVKCRVILPDFNLCGGGNPGRHPPRPRFPADCRWLIQVFSGCFSGMMVKLFIGFMRI